jgi:arsenate reductase
MNVLFLCTGNSARSILGEVIFNGLFSNHGCAYSAGSKPMLKVNPLALDVLQKHGCNIQGLRSKNIDEFKADDAPLIDLIISVCDSAAKDCPRWLGKGNPRHLHWSLSDPKTKDDFEKIYAVLKEKMSDLIAKL